MEKIINLIETQQQHDERKIKSILGILPYVQYNAIIKALNNDPNFLIAVLPASDFRLKHQIELVQNSVLSSNTYKLTFKHNNKPLLYCSKQLFGKYIFYSENQKSQQAYMSKYGNQYKLYTKQQNNKVQLAYFIINQHQGSNQQSKVLIPTTQNLSHLPIIISNNKKQSEIKWRWHSKSQAVTALKIEMMEANLLRRKYIHVSQGMKQPKMIMREGEDNIWEYFIQNPLNVIQGFALAILLIENFYK